MIFHLYLIVKNFITFGALKLRLPPVKVDDLLFNFVAARPGSILQLVLTINPVEECLLVKNHHIGDSSTTGTIPR